MNRTLLCCGDATDLATWSSIPYFLLQAGLKQGFLQAGLALQPKALGQQGHLWNLKQLLSTGKDVRPTTKPVPWSACASGPPIR